MLRVCLAVLVYAAGFVVLLGGVPADAEEAVAGDGGERAGRLPRMRAESSAASADAPEAPGFIISGRAVTKEAR
jgi:hypothetical protein